MEMVHESGVTAEIDMSGVPVFATVEECLKNDVLRGVIERNQEYSMAWVRVEDTGGTENIPVINYPQASGGLLISLTEENASQFVDKTK